MAIPGEDTKINTNEKAKSTNNSEENAGCGTKKKASPFLTEEPSAVAAMEPAVKLESIPEKKAAQEHSEEYLKDKSTFSSTGKLYFLSSKTNKLETRGDGAFYIFKDKSGMYRLMMIRDQFKLKGCNHYIIPSCTLTKATQLKNSWVWTALQDKSDAEKNEEKTVYFAVFKDEDTSALFESKYNEAKNANLVVFENLKADKKGKEEVDEKKESTTEVKDKPESEVKEVSKSNRKED